MDVTNNNFEEVLKTLPDVLRRAQFVSLDTEFTGLDSDKRFHFFDTLDDVYDVLRPRVTSFLGIQVGLCAFEYQPDTDKYTYRAYNFYMFPSAKSETFFTCQASSLRFLSEHGFDFNKLIGEGIPYMRKDKLADRLREVQTKYESFQKVERDDFRQQKPQQNNKRDQNVLPEAVEDFLKSDDSELVLPWCHRFKRNSNARAVREKHGDRLKCVLNSEECLVVLKDVTEDRRTARQMEEWGKEEEEVKRELGFRQLIDVISESGKLVVGHNALLDLMYVIHQFVEPLPYTFVDFRELLHHVFPKVIDTKFLASRMEEIADSSLECLLENFQLEEIPSIAPEEEGFGYLKDVRQHDAAYDAFVTGKSFLAMANRIGKVNMTNIVKVLPDSPLMKPYVNKLSLPSLYKITCLELGCDYVPADRSDVFHLTVPDAWEFKDIQNCFRDLGYLHVKWIDKSSLFLAVQEKHLAQLRARFKKMPQTVKVQTLNAFRESTGSDSKRKQDDVEEEDMGTVVTKKSKAFDVPDFD